MSAEAVARRYFDALARRDLDAAEACWQPGSISAVGPVGDLTVPDQWRAYFEELFAAIPDGRHEVLDVVAEGRPGRRPVAADRAASRAVPTRGSAPPGTGSCRRAWTS